MNDTPTDEELDARDMGEIRSLRAEGDWRAAWELAEELSSVELTATVTRGLRSEFRLVECPYCQGAGGWSGTQDVTSAGGWHIGSIDVDADCERCECLGLMSGEEVERYEAEDARDEARDLERCGYA